MVTFDPSIESNSDSPPLEVKTSGGRHMPGYTPQEKAFHMKKPCFKHRGDTGEITEQRVSDYIDKVLAVAERQDLEAEKKNASTKRRPAHEDNDDLGDSPWRRRRPVARDEPSGKARHNDSYDAREPKGKGKTVVRSIEEPEYLGNRERVFGTSSDGRLYERIPEQEVRTTSDGTRYRFVPEEDGQWQHYDASQFEKDAQAGEWPEYDPMDFEDHVPDGPSQSRRGKRPGTPGPSRGG